MKRLLATILLFTFAAPLRAGTLEYAGWIPYWRKTNGVGEAIAHISVFSEFSPFGYAVKHDGTLADLAQIDNDPWPTLFALASSSKVKIIPSVMWSNGTDINTVLKSPIKRKAHIEQIVSMVKLHNFDGVDIDYEGKLAMTRKYFSLFLKELKKSLGKKILSCTIEPRTPPTSQFKTIPKGLEYANDYSVINAYCDRVRIMTYDQGTIDLTLNKARTGPYVPISDPGWAEKVIRLAMKTISKKKIFIGVATYGYEYTVMPTQNGFMYQREMAFNQNYALQIMQAYGVNSKRNSANEISLIYVPTSTPLVISNKNQKVIPSGDTSSFGINAVTTSSNLGGANGISAPFRLLWWSDAKAVADKVELAKKLGVKGVAIFKIDGGADPAIWDVLK